MAAWLVWVLVAAALALGELLTLSLVLGLVAVAALAGAVTALAGAGWAIQIVVVVIAAAALVAGVRPVARRHLQLPAPLRTGAAALVGREALVLQQVDADGGQVKLAGEVWSARAYDATQVLAPGTRVEVVKIEGATALVL